MPSVALVKWPQVAGSSGLDIMLCYIVNVILLMLILCLKRGENDICYRGGARRAGSDEGILNTIKPGGRGNYSGCWPAGWDNDYYSGHSLGRRRLVYVWPARSSRGGEERREGEPKLLLEAINQFQTVGRGRSGTCCTAWPGLAWPGSTPPQGTG